MNTTQLDRTADTTILGPLGDELQRHLHFTLGHNNNQNDPGYINRAASFVLRDRLIGPWKETRERMADSNDRVVHYLSLEFLLGRSLNNALQSLDLESELRDSLHAHGVRLEEVVEEEHDAGLGNGGLGRLAACFLDSCAHLKLPVTGYGLRYEYGMFHQRIEDGHQIEAPDHWLRDGNPWEIERPEDVKKIKFYGRTERQPDGGIRWVATQDVLALPFDMPIPGKDAKCVNTLRLWKSTTSEIFDLQEFNAGSYPEAVAAKNQAEQISMVLYPNDASENGKELRLKQQYFLVSASLQDVIKNWVDKHGENFEDFGAKNCFQLNDTHPACAVPELMRLLIDEHGLEWDAAWKVTTECMAYTNHTLLPEALERWSVDLFSRLLPRLLEIIYEINAQFLAQLEQQFPNDVELRRRLSLIEEGPQPHVRMAYLSIVGSFSVNGVAALHTELLKKGLFADFYRIWPEKFNNKTNGVTQRRWLSHCNPELRDLLNETIGDGWEANLQDLEALRPYADDASFKDKWHTVKSNNKRRLSDYIRDVTKMEVDPTWMFDVQVKRIHEYKRQLLNILHIIHLYDRICEGDTAGMVPRFSLIGGKAAPGYHIAKLIVKLTNNVAKVVNNDPKTQDLLKVLFFPNYRVSAMEFICPGTDLSEQISTAGKEASGTGNMKFMMNGALTIGTLDGANIEIREHAGEENFFLFGLNAEEVVQQRSNYDPNSIIANDPEIERVMQLLEGGRFNENEPGIFSLLTAGLRNPHDQWLTIADFRSYIDSQREVSKTYADQPTWQRMSILNVATSGHFSSDRTIRQYADEIWNVNPVL